MDSIPTMAAKLRMAVQLAWVALMYIRCRTLIWSILECVLFSLFLVVTPTINQPTKIPLSPTNFQNLPNVQYQLLLLWKFFIHFSIIFRYMLQWHPLTPQHIACIGQKITHIDVANLELLTLELMTSHPIKSLSKENDFQWNGQQCRYTNWHDHAFTSMMK